MKLFSYSIKAQNLYQRTIEHTAGICVATNTEEAIGKAYNAVLQTYPATAGYVNQSISVCEVPQSFIDKVMEQT